MMVLWEKDKINVKTLGEKLYLDSGTLTPLLKKLEQKNYITKNINKEDERNQVIEITKIGKDLQKDAKTIPISMGNCINLTEEEAQTLYKILYKIIFQIEKEKNTSSID